MRDTAVEPSYLKQCKDDLDTSLLSASSITDFWRFIDAAKGRRDAPKDYLITNERQVWEEYERLLVESNSIDFNSMLDYFLTLLKTKDFVRAKFRSTYRWIIVDEYVDEIGLYHIQCSEICVPH